LSLIGFSRSVIPPPALQRHLVATQNIVGSARNLGHADSSF
jgi:hypothetical protein